MDVKSANEVLAYETIIEHGYKKEPVTFQTYTLNQARAKITVYLRKSRDRKIVSKVHVWALYPHIDAVCVYERSTFGSAEQVGGALTVVPSWKRPETKPLNQGEDLNFEFKVAG